MPTRRWLLALPLFLLAAAFMPAAAARVTKINSTACKTNAPGEDNCAAPDRIVQPALAARVISVWGGARDSIALKSDGTVWTWGLNNCDPIPFTVGPCGKLGDGTSVERHVPTQVHGPGNAG